MRDEQHGRVRARRRSRCREGRRAAPPPAAPAPSPRSANERFTEGSVHGAEAARERLEQSLHDRQKRP